MTYREEELDHSLPAKALRVGACLILLILAPILVTVGTLHLAEVVGDPSAGSVISVGWLLSAIPGIAGISLLPVSILARVLLSALAALLTWIGVLYFGLIYICTAFSKCL